MDKRDIHVLTFSWSMTVGSPMVQRGVLLVKNDSASGSTTNPVRIVGSEHSRRAEAVVESEGT
jgi:hypothetical protein